MLMIYYSSCKLIGTSAFGGLLLPVLCAEIPGLNPASREVCQVLCLFSPYHLDRYFLTLLKWPQRNHRHLPAVNAGATVRLRIWSWFNVDVSWKALFFSHLAQVKMGLFHVITVHSRVSTHLKSFFNFWVTDQFFEGLLLLVLLVSLLCLDERLNVIQIDKISYVN